MKHLLAVVILLARLHGAAPLAEEANDPAVSRDGRWLAYISDSGGLWIRPFAGGKARQLAEQASAPAFSPDGTTLAYRGEANGGGVYVLRVKGGSARLLALGGHRPRYSPDGRQIVYQTAAGVFLLDVKGGQPRRLHPSATSAAWSPDGKHLIVNACSGICEWWVIPVGGGEPIATGAAKLLRQHQLSGQPDLWLPSGKIVFAGNAKLWVLHLNPTTFQVEGAPRRLTQSEHDERNPVEAPDESVVYASRQENIDVYTMPLDADRATAKGPLARLTNDPSIDQRPNLSVDGTKIAWETSRGGNFEVWVKDLVSGNERAVTNGPLREHMPAVSRDGKKLLYDAHDGDKVTIFESAFEGGEPVNVREENVGQGSFQWSADGSTFLYFHRAPPGTVGLMNLVSKERTPLLRHPRYNLSLTDARLSPDDRWIAFSVPYAPHRLRLAVARVTDKVIDDELDWTYLTPETWNASQPEWSPNGQWLYFLSDATGKLAVYALPLSSAKAATAAARLVLNFPNTGPTIAEMRPRDIGLTIAKDKVALAATAYTGKLWSAR